MKEVAMFSYLPNCNIINGIPVDYMHGVLLGVTKSLLNFVTAALRVTLRDMTETYIAVAWDRAVPDDHAS